MTAISRRALRSHFAATDPQPATSLQEFISKRERPRGSSQQAHLSKPVVEAKVLPTSAAAYRRARVSAADGRRQIPVTGSRNTRLQQRTVGTVDFTARLIANRT